MTVPCAIFDLDGTLCDIRHRLHHVQDGAKDWDKFFAGIKDDLPNKSIKELLDCLWIANHRIVLCSGRPEKCRKDTEKWLKTWGVNYTALYMRPDNDSRPDHVVKLQILEGIRQDGFEPFVVIDDRQSVVDMWRDQGLCCLQAAPDERPMPKSAHLALMVGPSGAGKSTWLTTAMARNRGIYGSHVVSSDQIRRDLCGDFRDQSKNEQVFAAVHAIAKARLKSDLPVVIDATHLRRRDRMSAAALGQGCPVAYVVVNRPLVDKYRHAGWRSAVVKGGKPFDLIAHHEQVFNSQLKEILTGDNLPNVQVVDARIK